MRFPGWHIVTHKHQESNIVLTSWRGQWEPHILYFPRYSLYVLLFLAAINLYPSPVINSNHGHNRCYWVLWVLLQTNEPEGGFENPQTCNWCQKWDGLLGDCPFKLSQVLIEETSPRQRAGCETDASILLLTLHLFSLNRNNCFSEYTPNSFSFIRLTINNGHYKKHSASNDFCWIFFSFALSSFYNLKPYS